MPTNKEIRTLPFEMSVEQRAEDEPKRIIGHAAVFEVLSQELGYFTRFREKIARGAFDDALNDDVRALFNHDANYVLGRTTNKTLILSVDERGLKVDITPPDTQVARDLMVSIQRGDINQMSFAFTVAEDEWFEDKDENVTRTILKIDRLYDVSPVTYPAYTQTDVSAREYRSEEEIYQVGRRILEGHKRIPRAIYERRYKIALRKVEELVEQPIIRG